MKILEFLPRNEIKPIGGPSGYIYNLMSSFNFKDIELVSLPEFLPQYKKSSKKFPKFIVNFIKIFFFDRMSKKILKGDSNIENIDDYDAIHFHATYEVAKYRKQLESYKGKVILTTHSPCPMHQEIYHDHLPPIARFFVGKKVMKRYEIFDEIAFDRADYIVLPCPEAEEPYEHTWDKYSSIKERNKDKYRYIFTGCLAKKPKIEKSAIRKELTINDDDFLVSYAGRHNLIKGYDKLKKIASIYLSKHEGLFVICGKPGEVKPLTNKSWVEIGWTTNADSYINASNVFVLPNRETYFDLVALEVLSMGKIILASNTGGNKALKKLGENGVFLYDTEEEASKLLEKISSLSKSEIKDLENKNLDLYNEYFSNDVFCKNYHDLYLSILGERK